MPRERDRKATTRKEFGICYVERCSESVVYTATGPGGTVAMCIGHAGYGLAKAMADTREAVLETKTEPIYVHRLEDVEPVKEK